MFNEILAEPTKDPADPTESADTADRSDPLFGESIVFLLGATCTLGNRLCEGELPAGRDISCE